MVSRTRSRTLRVAATLGAALAATAVVAVGLAALLRPWLASILPSGLLGTGLLAAGLGLGLVAVQLRYVRRELLASVDARIVDREAFPDLHARVTRLAGTADAPVPDVAVVDSPVPNSCSVAGTASGTVVVSTGLLDRLDDDALDAVLAHELAHLRNRDAAVLTLASFLPAVVAGDYSPLSDLGVDDLSVGGQWLLGGLVLAVGYLLAVPSLPGAAGSAASLGAFAAAVVGVVVLGGVVVGVAATATVYLARELSREREFAADRAAAQLTGSPATLASTLQTLTTETAPAQDARRRASSDAVGGRSPGPSSHVSELCLLPYGFHEASGDETDGAAEGDAPEAVGDDGANGGPVQVGEDLLDSFALETRAHPPVEQRLAALRDMTERQARNTAAVDAD